MQDRQIRSSAPARIRRRGRSYWRSGQVYWLSGSPDLIEAVVAGNEDYDVELWWHAERGLLEGACSCPYFAGGPAICKHIWATLLAADEKQLLPAAWLPSGARLEPGIEPPIALDDILASEGPHYPWAPEPLPPALPAWRTRLAAIGRARPDREPSQQAWLGERMIVYLVDPEASKQSGAVVIEFRCCDRKKDGEWGTLKSPRLEPETVSLLPDPVDRQLLATVAGAREPSETYNSNRVSSTLPTHFVLPSGLLSEWLQLAASTGRLMMPATDAGDPAQLTWDESDEPWRLELEVVDNESAGDGDGGALTLTGWLARGEDHLPLADPVLLAQGGLVFFQDSVARLDDGGAFGWVPPLRHDGALTIPAEDRRPFLEALLELPRPPGLHLPEDLRFEEIGGTPEPRLCIHATDDHWLRRIKKLEVTLEFDYNGVLFRWDDERPTVFLPESSRLLQRDPEAERDFVAQAKALGVREEAAYYRDGTSPRLVLAQGKLTDLVHTLTAAGWHIEAEGRLYRQAGELEIETSSGVDWFDLEGAATFGDQTVGLPALLRALSRGDNSVVLDDGSIGVLPESWLEQYGQLAKLGTLDQEKLRFKRSQIGLLDALLAARPEIGFDRATAQARRQLSKFSGVTPRNPPRAFRGELREYQKEGLGWLHYLRSFGFGGCLADDMGLGKTVQLLALLESRRQLRHRKSTPEEERPGPSLVVVPKSLIFNWQREAERFTPRLRLLDYTGPQRKQEQERLGDYDIVLTTYGTLRRDIAVLQNREFDYAVLDEAQAIKNPKSATAKACRLLNARYRLALTGTPIENHVGELMSILDFLNPGLFGDNRSLTAPRAVREAQLGDGDAPNPQLALIAAAVRPFILRRTKSEVAKDLPEKIEQRTYCELPPRQRKDYDQLRRHYQSKLLGKIDERGLGRSKMHVLEALLRLRQAACHPGLIDPARREESSAKLDLLLPQLDEVMEEGHKALVFSQFTTMLSIVRSRLDARGICYEYLDGKTRNREQHINRFQEDPDCKLFLISLKAGGLGLNLTAAEYVFLLDPWWNPAVEAQAIDRTHRIGQTKTVFAYSLIARDTVEQKILDLQQSKRQLAEAIVRADTSLLQSITREDLVQLLS